MTKFYLSSVIWKIAHKVLSLTERLLNFIKQNVLKNPRKNSISVTSNHSFIEGCPNPPSSVTQYYNLFPFLPPIPNILQVTLPLSLLKGFRGVNR